MLSQDEIDQLVLELSNENYTASIPTTTYKDSSHVHIWLSYIGLNESFEYCSICDQKKETV